MSRWIEYLERKSQQNSHLCSDIYIYSNGTFSSISSQSVHAAGSIAKVRDFLWTIAEQSGVIRQVIIAPIRRIEATEALKKAYHVMHRYMFVTGKQNIIPVFAYHTDTGFFHVHALLFSSRSSDLYMKPTQLELLKYIAVDVYGEPIGKIAYLRALEQQMKSASSEEKRKHYRRVMQEVSALYTRVYREVNSEVKEMEP